jgi:two-component system sensor histidine kinase PhcS
MPTRLALMYSQKRPSTDSKGIRMKKELYAGYETEILNCRLAFSRGCAYLGIVLILAGIELDYLLYPSMQRPFAIARLITATLIFCVLLLTTKTNWGKENAHWMTFSWLLLPQMMIGWMISVTEGGNSLYSVGLHLAIYASGVALPFSFFHHVALCVLSYGIYFSACSFHQSVIRLHDIFFINSSFLIFAIIVSVMCAFLNERSRLVAYRLKAEVARRNLELEEEINKNLMEIKGKMLEQEKMAAIGTLAAGLLHEINNPVNFCLMAMNVAMKNSMKANEILNECLEDAKQGMQRVQHIVSDLKIFAYRKSNTKEDMRSFLFEKSLDSAIRLTAHETKGISITRTLPDYTLVRGDEAAIIGVLINLLSNAALAMRKNEGKNPAIDISGKWDGDRLHIAVQDNGPGISPENITRVFEPFFTTREIGQGLGLGLSISYSVIKRHGSILNADSIVGERTRMSFDLPKAE